MNDVSNVKRERPLSPHLSVYKPQITSMMSIMHRMTGMFILAGAFVFVIFLLSVAGAGSVCDCVSAFLKTIVGKGAIFLWVAAFYYHFFNGIRHLLWDTGRGLSKESASKSGVFAIIAMFVALAITWFAVYGG